VIIANKNMGTINITFIRLKTFFLCLIVTFFAFVISLPWTWIEKKTCGLRLFFSKGVAPPTYSRSARCRSFVASSQKFAGKTKNMETGKCQPWPPEAKVDCR